MKYNKTLTLIISFIPFIIIILYILFRYYLGTDYKKTVNEETFAVTIIITSFLWWYLGGSKIYTGYLVKRPLQSKSR